MFEALTSIPNASVSMGVRLHISRAGRKFPRLFLRRGTGIHFRAKLVITGKTIQGNTGRDCRFAVLTGISVYTSRKRRNRVPLLTQPNAIADHKELPRLQRDGHPFECPLPLVCGNS